jgi:hypothetical protein
MSMTDRQSLASFLSSLSDGRLVHLDQEITPSSDSIHIQVGEFRRVFSACVPGMVGDDCAVVGLCYSVLGWVYTRVSMLSLFFSSGLFLRSTASVCLVFVLRPGSACPVACFRGSRFGGGCFRGGGWEVSQDFGFYPESRLGNWVWAPLSSSSSVGVVVLRGFVRLRVLPEGSAVVRCPSVEAGSACVVCPLACGGGGRS